MFVILSEAKDLIALKGILRFAQDDKGSRIARLFFTVRDALDIAAHRGEIAMCGPQSRDRLARV